MHTASKISVRTITMTALLSAIAYILAFVEFPVPLSPPFARMDFSDFPALIGAFAFGPLAGVLIELVKNALQLFSTSTGGIGAGKFSDGRILCFYRWTDLWVS